MRTLPKIFLTGSIVLFVISLTAAGGQVYFGLVKPVSALLFIAFFIAHLVSRLDPEQYAQDNRLRDELLRNGPAQLESRFEPALGLRETLVAKKLLS